MLPSYVNIKGTCVNIYVNVIATTHALNKPPEGKITCLCILH